MVGRERSDFRKLCVIGTQDLLPGPRCPGALGTLPAALRDL